jgi:hypothetical protein
VPFADRLNRSAPGLGRWAVLALAILFVASAYMSGPHPPPSPSPAGTPGSSLSRPMAGASAPVNFRLSATLNGSIGVDLVLNAGFELSAGSIDENTTLAGSVGLSAAPTASLALSGLGASTTLPVSTLGAYGPVTIPGASYTYLGAQLSLAVTTLSSINATLSVGSGPTTAVGWDAPGNISYPVVAPPAASGTTVPVRLGAISYIVSAGLYAVGTVPILGAVSIPVVPLTPLGNVSGTPFEIGANWTVTAPPAITSFSADPPSATSGAPTVLTALTAGGSGPMQFSYSGLPPGCLSANLSVLRCQSTTTGTYRIGVTAVDPQGERANATLLLPVGAAASTTGSASGGIGPYLWPIALGGAVAAALAAGFLFGRRRRARASPRVS